MSVAHLPLRSLNELMDDRDEVLRRTLAAAERIVARQTGGYGFAVRAVYSMTQSLAPNMARDLIDSLLEEFLDALTPFYHEAVRKNVPVGAYIVSQKQRVAEALVAVTDARDKHEKSGAIRAGYKKLRPRALERVADGCPELGALVEQHVAAGQHAAAGRERELVQARA